MRLPLPGKNPQRDGVLLAPRHAPPLAAASQPGIASGRTTSSRKNRVGVFGRCPSGRTGSARRARRGTAPSCNACTYKVASGRTFFLNADPIGFKGGQNWYRYCSNDPINKIDPDGREWYNPYSWNWKTIGQAVEYKGGIGPGGEAKIQISKLDVEAGARVIMVGGWGNLAGESGQYTSMDAGVKAEVGKGELGLAYSYEAKFGYNEDHKYYFDESSDPVVGWGLKKLEGDSSEWFKVGVSAQVLLAEVGLSIDFEKVWDGITSEKPSSGCKNK